MIRYLYFALVLGVALVVMVENVWTVEYLGYLILGHLLWWLTGAADDKLNNKELD